MAVVGEAHILVKAITTGVSEQIAAALKKAAAETAKVGDQVGKDLGRSVNKGIGKKSPFAKLEKDAIKARNAFSNLQRTGFFMQSALGSLAGVIGSIIGALGGLVGALGAAAPAMVAAGGAAIGMGLGMKLASMALKGVTGPMNQVGKAATGTKKTIKELREEMQQLRFDAEDAALSEKEAAMNLEKARNDLARVQDLPPNSMARREAELAYEQADLALRRAIDRNNDLQDEIKNGVKDTADASAGVDPYAGLTKSQRAFAKLLVKLKPEFDKLKEAVAKGFLPKLGNGIDQLMSKNFPTLLKGFTRIGDALGNATDKIFAMIDAADETGTLTSLFETSAQVIEILGGAVAKLFGSVLTILKAASPITIKFVEWIDKMASKFETFINKAAGDGSLAKFFEDSAGFASKFGDIFGNIFEGIGALIADAFKPGSGASILLDWLKKATEGFANMGEDTGLHDFLAGTATNFTKMLDVFGGLFDIFNKLGADPNIGIMWDTLGKGLPLLEKILQDGADAGPKMAEVFYQVMRVVSAFSDNKTLEVFFDTLVDMATVAADFFNNPDVKKFMDQLGQIHGWFLAVGLGLIIAKKAGMILLGTFFKLLSPLKYFFWVGKDGSTKFAGHMEQMKQSLGKVKEAMGKAKDAMVRGFKTIKDVGAQAWQDLKIGVKLWADNAKEYAKKVGTKLKGAFDAAKTGATNFWNSAKNGFSTLISKSKEAAIAVGTKLKGAFMGAVGGAKKLWGSLVNVSKALWANTLQVMKNVAQWVAQKAALVASAIASAAMKVAQIASNVVTAIGTGIQAAFNAVLAVNPIVWIVLAIAALVAALIWFFTQTELGKQIWQGFMDFLIGLWNGIVAAVQAVVQWIVDAWNGLVAGITAIFDFIWGLIQGYIDIWIGIFQFAIDLIIGIWNGLVDGISTAINWVAGIFQSAWEGVSNFFRNFINGLIGMFEGFINFFINGINLIIDALGTLSIDIPDWVPLVGGQTWGIDLPRIPRFTLPRLADGGVVSPSQGGSLVNVAEAGKPERIEPLDENGMSKRDKAIMDMIGQTSGMNITVNPSAGMDETALAALVSRRIAFELRKGATA
jgi:hypothetical protein